MAAAGRIVLLLSTTDLFSPVCKQQEHEMKAKNGGKGMSDEQVDAFVAR